MKKKKIKQQIRKGGAPAHAILRDPGVYIFVDDRNLWVSDFGELLVLASRDDKGQRRGVRKVVISGTISSEDSFWQIARDQGFEVRLGYRGSDGRSEQDDTHMVADLVELVCTMPGPSTVVLATDDGDYGPALQKALIRGWKIEIVFFARGLSESLDRYAHVVKIICP